MNRFCKPIACLLVFVLLGGPVFAADPVVIEPYKKGEFPTWAKDLRRTEIITFGSMPFVLLTVSLAYSLGAWAATGFTENVPDLFSRTTDYSLSPEQLEAQRQKDIIIISVSAGISVILGLVDLFINIHQRKKAKPLIQSGGITVTVDPLADTPAVDGDTGISAEDMGESSASMGESSTGLDESFVTMDDNSISLGEN